MSLRFIYGIRPYKKHFLFPWYLIMLLIYEMIRDSKMLEIIVLNFRETTFSSLRGTKHCFSLLFGSLTPLLFRRNCVRHVYLYFVSDA